MLDKLKFYTTNYLKEITFGVGIVLFICPLMYLAALSAGVPVVISFIGSCIMLLSLIL